MSETQLLRSVSSASSGSKNFTQILQSRAQNSEPTLSFEFFPPKDEVGEASLWASFDKLLKVSPDYVSVTYGAGGSSRNRTLKIVQQMAKQVTTVGHLTCIGASIETSKAVIGEFEAAGVRAILALRGDAPKDDPDALEHGEQKTALELVKLVRESTELEIGVAAFPEVHPESPDLAHDAKVLALKQQAGASFGVTQLFFSLKAYTDLIAASRAAGVTMPIIPGLMPVANAKRVVRMAELSGAEIPVELLKKFDQATDEESARAIGMEYTIQLAKDLLAAGAPGVHIFSLNTHEAALELARGAGLCR